MRTSFVTFLIAAAALVLLVGGPASAASKHGSAKQVMVVMHDPGCHWFSVGGKFLTKLTVSGPVSLVNYDEAALRIVGPAGVKQDAIGKKVLLGHGVYKITMVKQAPDDNTLRLTVR
jgi:hypothetical protein